MVPLSLDRASSLGTQRREFRPSLAWLRPANITSASNVELRALIVWIALFVVAGVAIELGHVWLRLKVTGLGYQLSATRQVVERLEQEGHELTMEIAPLEASRRLEDAARTRLGMARPEKGQEAGLP
jgi:cell division protein FtsL